MKKILIITFILVLSLAIFAGCETAVEDPTDDPIDNGSGDTVDEFNYDDGTYRGVYVDRDGVQITIQFTLEDNVFTDLGFRQLKYSGENYLSLEDDNVLVNVTTQYNQAGEYLLGKNVKYINDLYSPEEFVDDIDIFAGATLRANKMVSSINDALNRGVYSPAGDVTVKDFGQLTHGSYRGVYIDKDNIQLVVQFTIEDNTFSNLSYRQLDYAGTNYRTMDEDNPLYAITQQHLQVLEYLDGKPIETVYDLYNTGDFVNDIDTYAGATLRGNKIVSSIIDGINRGVYNPSTDNIVQVETPDDGRYRGVYIDRDETQVVIQFVIEEGMFSDITFRKLSYSGQDYRALEDGDALYPVLLQHQQIAEYLIGKPFEAVYDLHFPDSFMEDIDTFAGATVRANKVFSSILDGINRGKY